MVKAIDIHELIKLRAGARGMLNATLMEVEEIYKIHVTRIR